MNAAIGASAEISEEEYLASEVLSDVKREYLGGAIYAMAGASEAHNRIAMNLYAALHAQLRGKPCEVFGSDMKIRLVPLDSTYFYYPDAMIACDSKDGRGKGWRERPTVLFEIISEDTRRVDEREKRLPYLQLPSLKAYVRIEQQRVEVAVDRQNVDMGWRTQQVRGLEAVLRLPEVGVELPLVDLYDRIDFSV